MNMINEIGRGIMQGGSRRSAIWAGLNWSHGDAISFIKCKDWTPELRALKQSDFTFPAPMELTNISILLDDDFFVAYEDEEEPLHEHAHAVYSLVVKRMLNTAEPGLSIDVGPNRGETLRNACTEITSRDDSDICNLGSINLARIEDINEFSQVVTAATLFLLAGTVYSDVPYEKVDHIRTKNRRLGLGLMGVHEWLLQRGYRYEPNEELGTWLDIYSASTDIARKYARLHNLTPPVKTRAIAPTGTIGIIAETTTGIEPIFCVAYKRRYLVGDKDWRYQYVVDPTAQRLVDQYNIDPDDIEDAYSLSLNVERRIAFQAWMQRYVDHAISSTINLPANNAYPVEYFKDVLYKYLPSLRGVTAYPDGARGGQPLSPASYETAIAHSGVVFEESEERCTGGLCGV
jgi:ribonucleoside-diphosphate reductase alpha chain